MLTCLFIFAQGFALVFFVFAITGFIEGFPTRTWRANDWAFGILISFFAGIIFLAFSSNIHNQGGINAAL